MGKFMSKPVTLGSFFEIAKGRWAEVRGFYEPPTLAKPAIPEDFMPWLFEGVKGGALEARLIAPSGGGANPSGGLWGSVKDAGLQAMGKRSREKRERRESGETRAPRSDVQVFDDGISVHGGAKGPFTIFYLKARKEWQTDSGPDKKNARDVMVFLDEHGHFAAAVRYAIVVEGGDHKTYKALGVLHSRPMSDDRIGEVEAFVDAEYARLFPYDSGLPVENNIFGWLIARLSAYKAGRISAAQIADCIGSFADVSPVKPELTETGFRFGPVEVSGSEALKIVIKGAETIIADRLRGDREASRLAEQISASFRENRAGQTTAHGSGISSVSKAVEAVSISQMLGYLKNSDVPVGIREKTAVIYVLGGEEGSLLSDMFGSNIEVEAAATGRGKSIDFVLQPARLSPEAFCAKVEASYRAFFGIKDNPDVRDIAEEREFYPPYGKPIARFQHGRCYSEPGNRRIFPDNQALIVQ
ncbi:MAG: hypothetical protein HYU98_00675 [Deltaproteobacteria bacterium]|nr:hypothetical protein [Deltaproteobacteria bacterium]